MPIHSLFLGFAKTTKDDLTEFYELLPAFWSPQLEVTQVFHRTPSDIEYQVIASSEDELKRCLNGITLEFLQNAWDIYCQAQDRPTSLVPLSPFLRSYGFDTPAVIKHY